MSLVVQNQNTAIANKIEVSPELAERISEAQESLETLHNLSLPKVSFKDGKFIFPDGDSKEVLKGVILYTKAVKAYFPNNYKAGKIDLPECYSNDSISPETDLPDGKAPKAIKCAKCPLNEFKTAKQGDGKACRDFRLVYFIQDGSIMPCIIKVPPTSLRIVEDYIKGCAANIGAYYSVETELFLGKKDAAQTHFNIFARRGEKLDPQNKTDVKAIRELWLAQMKNHIIDVADEGQTIDAVHTEASPVDTSEFAESI